MIEGSDFDGIYRQLIKELFENGTVSISRKGKKLTELFDFKFVLTDPNMCMAVCREMSYTYLANEFDFYMSGSNKLADAVKCSPFWEKCSDDGVTINSNYGKLLFHDVNRKGHTQFEHAVNCLKNSVGSKKAVMTLYNNENAYISNDNPCTMFLRARIDSSMRLHLTAVMRSSDIYYGLPYDVPFFCFVQKALTRKLRRTYPDLTLGTYTHIANSLHFYEYKRAELEKALNRAMTTRDYQEAGEVYLNLALTHLTRLDTSFNQDFMERAWEVANKSGCYKKRVGCVFTIISGGKEHVLVEGYGDIAEHRDRFYCEPTRVGDVCSRDNPEDIWYETGCPSVHAEHRAMEELRRRGHFDKLYNVTVYVTHGPCDGCLKMLDMAGVSTVYYDIPYKTDYSHWPNMLIKQIPNPSNREPGKYGKAPGALQPTD